MSDLGNKAIMAENIQRLMDSRGIDRNKICADLGFKYTTFTDWVKGNTYPRIDKIEMMANYFGVPKSQLVEKYVEDGYYSDAKQPNLRSTYVHVQVRACSFLPQKILLKRRWKKPSNT